MVTFRLLYQSEKEIKYEYFPEGDEICGAGVIGIDLEKEEINVLQPAEKDFLIKVTTDNFKEMRDSINEIRAELGETPLTEEELPAATEDSSYYCYASKAIKEITEGYNKGYVLKDGCVVWY